MTPLFEQMAADFAALDDLEQRYEYLIDLGREAPPFPDAFRTEGNKVRGCASQVWLVEAADSTPERLHFWADSDALIVKGLSAVLMAAVNGRSQAAIATLNPHDLLAPLGLGSAISAQRSNGFHAMTQKVRELAKHRTA